jgi:integrase
MRRPRLQFGGVYLDRRYGIWYYRRSVNGERELQRIGTLADYPTKALAMQAAQTLIKSNSKPKGVSFEVAALCYMSSKRMPQHPPTAGGYSNYLENYCIPRWGSLELSEITARPLAVELWLATIVRAPKTRAHIRDVMRRVFEFAMADGMIPVERNPLGLVKVKGASKRAKVKRVLTYAEWERFIANVAAEPQRTAIITCMCLGIRREEIWALKWSDIDFVKGTVTIQRTIIESRVYERTKNQASEAELPLDDGLVQLLLDWRAQSQFNRESDWVWGSPYSGGEMPYHFQSMQKEHIVPASVKAGLGNIGWHTFRHTYRSWLNAAGTPLGVQKDLMRHANITTTANVYGAGVVDTMREFNSAVVKRVIQ